MKKNEMSFYILLWTVFLLSFFCLIALYHPVFFYDIYRSFRAVQEEVWKMGLYSLVTMIFFVGSLLCLLFFLFFKKHVTEINKSEIGKIDLSMKAVENIALNSARTAQAGIKSATATAGMAKDRRLLIKLDCDLYSDVEIPNQMRRIQERIKKDIEKYTGLAVSEVKVNIRDVETIGAKVER